MYLCYPVDALISAFLRQDEGGTGRGPLIGYGFAILGNVLKECVRSPIGFKVGTQAEFLPLARNGEDLLGEVSIQFS